jgi:hypothetical protein
MEDALKDPAFLTGAASIVLTIGGGIYLDRQIKELKTGTDEKMVALLNKIQLQEQVVKQLSQQVEIVSKLVKLASTNRKGLEGLTESVEELDDNVQNILASMKSDGKDISLPDRKKKKKKKKSFKDESDGSDDDLMSLVSSGKKKQRN